MTQRAAVVRELLKHASRAEAPVVETLALAAGMLWRCWGKSCRHVNDDGEGLCAKCGMGRKLP